MMHRVVAVRLELPNAPKHCVSVKFTDGQNTLRKLPPRSGDGNENKRYVWNDVQM